MSQNFVWRCVQFNTSLHTHMHTQKFNIPASILKFVFDIHIMLHCTSALVAKLAWIQVKVWSRSQNLITKLHPAIPFHSSPVQSSPVHSTIPFHRSSPPNPYTPLTHTLLVILYIFKFVHMRLPCFIIISDSAYGLRCSP